MTKSMTQSAEQDHFIQQQILEQAVDWSMRLSQGELDEQDLAALAAWQQQSPLHLKAWQKMQQLQQTFEQLPTAVARPVLNQSSGSGWLKRSHYILLLATLAGLYLVYDLNQQQQWTADYRSGTAEFKQITLPDGGELRLDSASAIDVHYTEKSREIVLRKGQVWIKTAKDPQQRPFYVQTQYGQAQALGTEFAVELDQKQTWVKVEQGAD